MNSLFLFCFLIPTIFMYPDFQTYCDGTETLDGLSDSYPATSYFPKTWNENKTAPYYRSSQHCIWVIQIPDKKYALFTMMADISDDSLLVVSDCIKRNETVMTSEQQPYIFVGTFFAIDLTIGPNGNGTSFGFKVQWNDYPAANSTYYTVDRNNSALVSDEIMFDDNALTIMAESQVSIVVFPSFWPDFTPLLRLSLIFDGPNITSPYLGTLFQAVRCNKPVVSSSHQLTVYTFQEGYFMGPVFVAQDYYNVKNLAEVKGITCMSNSSCPVTLSAANGPVSAMTLNIDDGDEFIKRLDLSSDAILKVYTGARKEGDESNLIVSYDLDQSKSNIPQKFNGAIMTYYLEKGTALVELAEDSNYTRWNDAVVGREGFITSTNYGLSDIIQTTYEYIAGLESNQTFAFTINVKFVDISNGSALTIDFGNESGNKEIRFCNENPTQATKFTEIGTNMTVYYVTNGTETNGFYLDFKIGSSLSSSSYANTLIVFSIILLSLV